MKEEIGVEELETELTAGLHVAVVDVRSPTEFASGHIAGAVNVPLPELGVRLADLDPERRGRPERLVLACERGMRARAAEAALLQCYPEARVLRGGMHAWRQAGLPVVRVTRTHWSLERQVRLIAGTLVLVGVALGLAAGPVWGLTAAVPGAGLVLAGLTDLCPLGLLLGRMPWNRICERPAEEAATR